MALLAEFTDTQYRQIKKQLNTTQDDKRLFNLIVNAPFPYRRETTLLHLGIVVLLLVNKKHATIERIALSNTELAENTVNISVKRFEDIVIPLNYPKNIIAQAIATNTPQTTNDWRHLFSPALTPKEARLNQAAGGIGYSAVYPLNVRDGGALIFSFFQYPHEMGPEQTEFMQIYSQLVTDVLKRSTAI